MSNTLRWSLAAVATCLLGLALLLAGVAVGRITTNVTGYEPADARPNTYYGPTDAGSGYDGTDGRIAPDIAQPDTTLAPVNGRAVDGNSRPGMMESGMVDEGFGPDRMIPGTMNGNAGSGMMESDVVDTGFGPTMMESGIVGEGSDPGTMGPGIMDGNYGSGTMGPGMMGGNAGPGMTTAPRTGAGMGH